MQDKVKESSEEKGNLVIDKKTEPEAEKPSEIKEKRSVTLQKENISVSPTKLILVSNLVK